MLLYLENEKFDTNGMSWNAMECQYEFFSIKTIVEKINLMSLFCELQYKFGFNDDELQKQFHAPNDAKQQNIIYCQMKLNYVI